MDVGELLEWEQVYYRFGRCRRGRIFKFWWEEFGLCAYYVNRQKSYLVYPSDDGSPPF